MRKKNNKKKANIFKIIGISCIALALSFGIVLSLNNYSYMNNAVAKVNVKSVKIDKDKVTINKGQSMSLKATINPGKATNAKITWTSSNSNAVKVDKNGKVTGVGIGTATITAMVNGKKATCKVTSKPYVITEDTKYKKYQTAIGYSSKTLKYRIIRYQNNFISLIWVDNASQQLNSALASSKATSSTTAEKILSNEIKNYGYKKKGLIAVNASFYAPTDKPNGTPLGGVVLSHGNIAKSTGKSMVVIGINKNGKLEGYEKQTASALYKDGVRNTFTISGTANLSKDTSEKDRTQICQYDENNFVLLTGNGKIKELATKIDEITGCKVTYNLDGGASQKLYYKKSGMTSATKLVGGSRIIPDMLYFVEQ